jgi:hypothetical protein
MRQFHLPKNKTPEELIERINNTSDPANYEDVCTLTSWVNNPDLAITSRELKNSAEGGVNGVRTLPAVGDGFLTWSSSGLIKIWGVGARGRPAIECTAQLRVPLEDSGSDVVQNQLSIVEPLSLFRGTEEESKADDQRLTLVTGDRFGIVRVVGTVGASTEVTQSFYAHSSEVIDIACAPPTDLKSNRAQHPRVFVTSSRDKTVQIFVNDSPALADSSSGEWRLLQTLVTHKTSVVRVLVADAAGEHIVSCANDRTAVIHRAIREGSEIVAYIPEKVISLKSAPMDMLLDHSSASNGTNGNLIVSCNDKMVYIYQFPSGELAHFYKVGDRRAGSLAIRDLSILRVPASFSATEKPGNRNNKKQQSHWQKYLIATGTDKSVRVYRHPDGGTPVACQWVHCEGISGLLVVSGTPRLVRHGTAAVWTLASCGHDGCLVFWELKISLPATGSRIQDGEDDAIDDRGAMKRIMPTRKVISKTDLARLARPSSGNAGGNLATPAAGSTTRSLTVAKTRPLRHSMSALSLETSSSSTTSSLSSALVPSRPKQAPNSNANGEKTMRRTLSTSAKSSYPLTISKHNSLSLSQHSAVLPKPKREESGPDAIAKPSQSAKPVLRQLPGSSNKENKGIVTTKLDHTTEILAHELAQFRRQYRRCLDDASKQHQQKPALESSLPPVTPAALESLRKELRQTLLLLDKQASLSS